MDPSRTRHTRKSISDLRQLSVTPLTTKFSIVGNEDELDYASARRSSYIEGKSAPTTPGILSRSPSTTRIFPSIHSDATSPISLRSKSTTQLHRRLPSRRSGTTRSAPKTNPTSSEWLLRTSAVISSETRESKGQSWLISRASSTSLVDRWDEDEEDGVTIDESYSRAQSRRGSTRQLAHYSRRGSRYGSREYLTPQEFRTPREGYFDAFDSPIEGASPDFVIDEEEVERRYLEEMLDEDEITRLTRQRGVGLGSLVDRVVGWSLFAVDERDAEQQPHSSTEDLSTDLEKDVRRKRRLEGERVVLAERPPPAPTDASGGGNGVAEGSWRDAAWLLSVASKVIL